VVQDVFPLGVAAGDGVADHHEVRAPSQIRLGITGHDLDFSFGQKGRHRRINILVGTGDVNAFVLQGSGG